MDRARRRDRADLFEVTPQTIRKDLNAPCEGEALARLHGGAVCLSGLADCADDACCVLAEDVRCDIAARAGEPIPGNASIMLDIGIASEQVALASHLHQGTMIVAGNINIAEVLRDVSSGETVNLETAADAMEVS